MSSNVLREVCFLIGVDDQVLWSDASASPVALADSRARWEAIWRLRDQLVEIAHSHPVGPLAFSLEDETTMAALAAALAHTPRFSIVAPTGMLVRVDGNDQRLTEEPPWAARLRQASGMQVLEEKERKRGEP
jgi:Prokaryotic homologs of the JAB domain